MIQLDVIKNYYPDSLSKNIIFHKYILKEYILLLILDYLSTTSFIRKIAFIGGTSIRLIKNIDRFSEDLDFDCKYFSKDEFTGMTGGIIKFLLNNGLKVAEKKSDDKKLKAFRSNLHFPELMFQMGLSGHKEERFLIKIECQDQLADYKPEMINIKGCGFFFPIPALYLFWRRLASSRVLYISGLPDYITLILLTAIASTGMLVHYFARDDASRRQKR